MASCTYWVRETLIVGLVVCSLQCTYATTHEKYIYFNNSELNWWQARANCQGHEGDLLVPVTDPEPSYQSGTRYRDTHYWLGAMRYLTWTWTDDDSPLYINYGVSTLPDDPEADMSCPDNSVFKCQGHCGSHTHTLGLSRDKCFCLGDDDYVSSINTPGERCPGNPDEVCGDASHMSIYKHSFEDLKQFVFIPTENGQCGYVIWKNDKLIISLDSGDRCKTLHRKFACNKNGITSASNYKCGNDVCVSKYWRTWTEANARCKLVKGNSSIVNDLKWKMDYNWKYWIGLVYKPTMKWIMDVPFDLEASIHDDVSSSEPHCLAVSFMTWYSYLSWEPCSSLYASICEVVRPKTSTTPTYQPTESVPTSESYKSTSINNPGVGPAEPATASNSTQTGVYIGLGCVVLILVVIIVVLLLMRQNQLCLKRKDNEQPVYFNTATQSTTSHLEVPAQTNTSAYSDITLADMADVKSVSSAVPMATVRPRVQNYDNTFPSDGNENDYNVLSQPGKHQTAGTPEKPTTNLQGSDKGDYDTAQAWGQGSGSTGLNNSEPSTATKAPKNSLGDDNVVGQHNPGGAADVYNHLGNGDHATSQQGKTPREVDDSYSHIGRTNKGFDENAYDVTSMRQTEDRHDDTCNHTDNAGDTNDYYNTRCLFRDNNEGLGGQDDTPDNTDVYNLAKRISDA